MTNSICRRRWARCDAPPLPSSPFIEEGLRLQSKSAVPKISLILLVISSPRPPREFDAYPIFSTFKLLKAPSSIDSPSSLYCDSLVIACHLVICTNPLQPDVLDVSLARLRRVQKTGHHYQSHHPTVTSFCRLELSGRRGPSPFLIVLLLHSRLSSCSFFLGFIRNLPPYRRGSTCRDLQASFGLSTAGCTSARRSGSFAQWAHLCRRLPIPLGHIHQTCPIRLRRVRVAYIPTMGLGT